jgi:hypothetical protein
MVGAHSKHTFDARRIAHGDLDVRLLKESRGRVDGLAFGEEASHGIGGPTACPLQHRMNTPDDRTIESSQTVVAVAQAPA